MKHFIEINKLEKGVFDQLKILTLDIKVTKFVNVKII